MYVIPGFNVTNYESQSSFLVRNIKFVFQNLHIHPFYFWSTLSTDPPFLLTISFTLPPLKGGLHTVDDDDDNVEDDDIEWLFYLNSSFSGHLIKARKLHVTFRLYFLSVGMQVASLSCLVTSLVGYAKTGIDDIPNLKIIGNITLFTFICI